MYMRTLSAFALLAPLAAPSNVQQAGKQSPMSPPTAVELPKEGVSVPLMPGKRLPCVEVWIDGAGPYSFIVEWAGNVLAVSDRVREEAGLQEVGRSGRGTSFVAIPEIRVGDGVFVGMVADVMPFFSETDHDGALGLNVFQNVVGVLDFPGQELHLTKEGLPDPKKDASVVSYSPGPGGTPRIPIELNGETFQAVLDTAAEEDLIVDDRYLDRLGIVGELQEGPMIMTPMMGRMQTQVGRIAGELVIGNAVTPEPEAMFHRMQEPEILLGGGFLRDCALTLDQKNHRLRLARPKAETDDD